MKKIITLILLIFSTACVWGQGRDKGPRMSPDEYTAKQQEYITQHAKLTTEEANKFFPLFFELQQKKWEIHGKAWKQINPEKMRELSATEYESLLYGLADAKIAEAKLEKEYIGKYRAFLSAKKILDTQHAEEGFQRDLLRKMIERRNNSTYNVNPQVLEQSQPADTSACPVQKGKCGYDEEKHCYCE